MRARCSECGGTSPVFTVALLSTVVALVTGCPATSFLQDIEGKVNAAQGNTFSLTVTAGSGGSVSPVGTFTVANGGVTSIAATAGTNNGFVVWTVTSGSGVKFGNANAASTTVTLTGGNATIQANFGLIIETVAGNGTAGYSGDSGPAISATLNCPLGIAFDTSGDMYILDNKNSRVRKISPSGIITTIAGTGVFGYSGDGGPATSAKIGGDTGIAVDAAGDVYIAEYASNRVRRIDTSGVITTWAGTGTGGSAGVGGPATSMQLNGPAGVCFDKSGYLYIADSGNNRIVEVNSNGSWTALVAGNGTAGHSGDGGPALSAELNSPGSIVFDASGNGYIADTGNNCVRKLLYGASMQSFAGNGTAGYSGDGAQADLAELSGPTGLALDSAGNLYIAEIGNNRIRKVSASGIITTFAGTGTVGYSGDGGPGILADLNAPFGVAISPSGVVHIADTSNDCIRKMP